MIYDELPNDIEFHLLSLGFYPSERDPNAGRNAPIARPKPQKKRGAPDANPCWTPSFKGEEPPF